MRQGKFDSLPFGPVKTGLAAEIRREVERIFGERRHKLAAIPKPLEACA